MANGRSVLGDQAYRRLKDEIISGRLAPGELVTEIAVSSRLGLSRTPLREAIGRLAEDGLVQVSPNRPARVRPVVRETALELIDLMRTLSMRAHDLAAERIGEEDIAELRLRTEQLAAAIADRQSAVQPEWGEFPEDVVYQAAGNEPLLDAISRIRPRMRRLVLLVFSDRFGGLDVDELRARADAMERHDADAAVRLARAQFDRLEQAVLSAESWQQDAAS